MSRYRKRRDVVLMLFLILFLVGAVDSARAEIVTYDFRGTITQMSGTVFGLSLSIGQPVEGRITYDTGLPVFEFLFTGSSIQPLPSGMSAVIGGVTVQSAGDASLQVINDLPAGFTSANPCTLTNGPLDNFNGFFGSIYVNQVFKIGPFNNIGFAFNDFTLAALSSTAALPNPLDFFSFSQRLGCIADAASGGRVHFSLDPKPVWGDVTLWIGLKNGDDQGTQFDLRTELSINGSLVAEGESRCITGVTRNPGSAKEVNVQFEPGSAGMLATGDVVSLAVLTRIGTNPDDTKCSGLGGSHSSAVGLRLYYDSMNRPSRLGAGEQLTDLFLNSHGTDFFLDAISPVGASAQSKDSAALNFARGNPWKQIGTWNLTVP